MIHKTHFAYIEPSNESTLYEYEGEAICNTPTEDVTNYYTLVTCKKCLNILDKKLDTQFIKA